MQTLVAASDPNEPQRNFTLSTFDFHGHQAAVLTDQRGHWVFPGQLCNFMGIDGNAQRHRIERKHWSEGWTSMTNVQLPSDTQSREHFLLHQRRLATWLGSIDTARIKDPTTRVEVEQHQTEFADALADYLTKGVALNPRAARQEVVRPQTNAELILQMAQEQVAQEQRLKVIEQAQAVTAAKVEAIEGRHDEFTALGYAKLHDFPTGRPFLQRVGIKATALMRAEGQVPHRRQDATFGEINVYPVAVLDQAFAEVPR
ncbi:phage antirepressor N-terminal domain-containing protein [Streptomyces sp. NPDC093223]|uniref:phage antirepressor N-terminal domain-containing protein n=1 Tax=Streptomyces sp. NPDC093223 TaxID=3366033 RepID=UPI003806B201